MWLKGITKLRFEEIILFFEFVKTRKTSNKTGSSIHT
ncbi:MAG: hypothetical protein ACI85I_001917 [Arenicella sp.]